MFIWTFLITKTEEITSCSYALKSWNTLYKCDVCGKGFGDSSSLVSHKRSHTGKKPFSCHICCKAFSWSGHLTMHLHTHSGDKTLVCEIYSKWFAEPRLLVKHLRFHSKEKEFPCDVCGKSQLADNLLFTDISTQVKSHTDVISAIRNFQGEIILFHTNKRTRKWSLW